MRKSYKSKTVVITGGSGSIGRSIIKKLYEYDILNIDNINSNCEIGVDILPEERNKGFATKAYKCVLEYLFKHKNMHTIYLKVADFNPKAELLYEKIGFVKTGYLSEYLFRNGKYWNYNIMCITFDEYIKKNNIN